MQTDELQTWLRARLPAALLAATPQIRFYADEIVIVLLIDPPAEGGSAAEQELIARQREATRALRMQAAGEIQRMAGLPVAWGMRAGASEILFTTRTVPVMTRLGRAEREVLDTLVAAGVAETRSSALAYAVRAFAAEHAAWLAEIRGAIAEVQRVRSRLKLTARHGAPHTIAPDPPSDQVSES